MDANLPENFSQISKNAYVPFDDDDEDEVTEAERIEKIRHDLRTDFPHYAATCLFVRTKSGAVKPLVLNEAQLYIHECLEDQKRRKGRVRAIILKGRQQGASTYVEARYYHITTNNRGMQAYILTHLDDATKNLFDMAKRYHKNCPELVRPHTTNSNAKELVFDKLDSGYVVATAGSKGAGRSSTLQLFHGSEVAYWPNARDHVAGAMQAVPREDGTEIILESTSSGPDGMFWEMCKTALAGKGEYELIFVPWFWQTEYAENPPNDFVPSPEELDYAEEFELNNAQLYWRRLKIDELGGISNFKREYPSTPDEAFEADAEGALWSMEVIAQNRVDVAPELHSIVVAVDPAAKSHAKAAETGIVAVGVATLADGLNHYYILRDASVKGLPEVWGLAAVDLYDTLDANFVVGELNNGGDMVAHVVRSVDSKVVFRGVHASRGKYTRAEPISTLYAQGRVHHVGNFPALETQMRTWVPGNTSPDRMDAMVWGVTCLDKGAAPPPDDVGEIDMGLAESYWGGPTGSMDNPGQYH